MASGSRTSRGVNVSFVIAEDINAYIESSRSLQNAPTLDYHYLARSTKILSSLEDYGIIIAGRFTYRITSNNNVTYREGVV